jgi:hypothetical protein
VGLGEWMRTQVACYGAVIAIILQQLDAHPTATVTESPNPLVRVQDRWVGTDEWHPDELVTQQSGRTYVVVWDDRRRRDATMSARILSN